MAQVEITDADHIFKTRYAKKLAQLLGEHDKLQKMFPFSEGELVGQYFEEAADLEYEHGFTFGGNDQAPALRTAISSDGEKAQVTPSQIIGRKKVGYRDLFRSAGAGEKAFSNMSVKKFTDLALGMRRNIEISLLHGQSPNGIGVVSSLSSQIITITDATWAPGIWMGAVNMAIDVMQSNLTTARQLNLAVGSIDEDNKAVTVVGTTTGIIAGDVIMRNTASVSGTLKECLGLMKILRTTTGNLFNVPTTHNLWKPNAFDLVSTGLNMAKLLKAAAKGVPKGLQGTAVAIIPVRAFEPLNEQISALREYDGSYKPQEALNGVEAITYRYQGGKLMVVPHIMMMEGEFAIIPFDESMDAQDRPVKRIGSVDMTFELPDNDGKIFLQVTDTAAKEVRNYTDQALYINRPGQCTLGKNMIYP